MSEPDYKNGWVVVYHIKGVGFSGSFYYNTEQEAKDAYRDILQAINDSLKIMDVPGQNTSLRLDDVTNVSYEPSAEYIRNRYEASKGLVGWGEYKAHFERLMALVEGE